MKKYKEFLLEIKLWKGTKQIPEKEAIEIFKNNCSKYLDYNKNGKEFKILRTVKDFYENYYYVNPKEYERKSLNTYNYYTLIMNNDKTWKEFPKRKLICRIRLSSSLIPYIVIPFDDSKWGVCTDTDMWFSYSDRLRKYGMGRLDQLTNLLHKLYTHLFKYPIRDDNFDDFKEDLIELKKELVKEKENIKDSYILNPDGFYYDTFIKDLLYSESIYDFLVDLLNPNHFEIVNATDFNPKYDNREVWTDDQCLLIHPYEYYNFIKKVQK